MTSISSLNNILQNLNSGISNSVTSSSVSQTGSSAQSSAGRASSTKVSLSDDSRYQGLLSQIKANKVTSSGGYDTMSMSALENEFGNNLGNVNADFLNDKPDSTDPARLALASQASDYIKSLYQGSDQGKNPFDGLSRQTLSSIAYDKSGSFTSAERLAASFQMDAGDNNYRTSVNISTQGVISGNNDNYNIIDISSQLKIIDGMSDAEKSEKGITDDSIKQLQDKLNKLQSTDTDFQYTAKDYSNLVKAESTDLLIAQNNGNGNYTWATGSSTDVFSSMVNENKKQATDSMLYIGS